MRKAKRGLKRSEARRSGHRTYVHKQRPEDRLTSGAAFAREIRVRTTRFASESESRAITSASQSPPRGAIRGAGGEGGALGGGDAGAPGAGWGGIGGWEGLGDGGASSWLTTGLMSSTISWFPTGSWGTKLLQDMTDAARAPAEFGVAASHARVLREWRQRYDGCGLRRFTTARLLSRSGLRRGRHDSSRRNSVGFHPYLEPVVVWTFMCLVHGGLRATKRRFIQTGRSQKDKALTAARREASNQCCGRAAHRQHLDDKRHLQNHKFDLFATNTAFSWALVSLTLVVLAFPSKRHHTRDDAGDHLKLTIGGNTTSAFRYAASHCRRKLCHDFLCP